MSVNWNKEQLQAIEYDQPNPLLVSAAAGSGKTAVLIERIFQRVMSRKIDPENLLVATFTDKAATQMRQKIDKKIADEMQETQNSETLKYLRELKRRFPLAQISTIHAFCLKIIREYGAYLTDQNGELILQPGFDTVSTTYKEIYLSQAVDEVLTYIYKKISEKNDPSEQKQEDVNTSFVSQGIPEVQKEIKLFNLLEESISEASWLEDFNNLALMVSDSLDDKTFREQLIKTLNHLRSMAYFEQVTKLALAEYEEQAKDFWKHPVVAYALDQIKPLINPALEGLEYALNSEQLRKTPKSTLEKATGESSNLDGRLSQELSVVHEISRIINLDISNIEKWDMINEQGKKLGNTVSLRANRGATLAAQIKTDFIENYEPNVLPLMALIHPTAKLGNQPFKRNQLENTNPYFIRSSAEIERDLKTMIRPMARFLETVILIDRRFQQIKMRHNQVDFNDYEHYALRLLDQPEIAALIHDRYKEIYLDEYQDTNPIQETVISKIKCPRVFMVGDLKQSIYRFRFADPGIFRNKLNDFFLYENFQAKLAADQDLAEKFAASKDQELSAKFAVAEDQELSAKFAAAEEQESPTGYTVLLNRNFRSSETVLLAINDLFSWFMNSERAELNYDRNQALIPGREDLSEQELGVKKISVEHLVLPYKIKEFDLSLIPEIYEIEPGTGTEFQLAFEALQAVKIIKRELMSGRKLNQIAILSRNHKISGIYKKVLAQYGIPVSGGKNETYLETPELKILTQLMSLLDNFQQDIPLASVMRSEIFGIPFDENELLLLRLSQPDLKYYHEVVQKSASLEPEDFVIQVNSELVNQENQIDNKTFMDFYPNKKLIELHDKLQQFMGFVGELRSQAKWLSLSELLDNISRIANYGDYLLSLPFAEQRLSDFERFQQWANSFEKNQGGGLRNFIVYINKILEQKLELEDFDTPPTPSDSVATMTIHASKGLEFPVVILAGANDRLERKSSSTMISFDPEYGLSGYIVDPEQQVTYSTPSNAWHQEQMQSKEWAEEYRLLYVALTRAEEKLYVLSNAAMSSGENDDFSNTLDALSSNFSRSNFQRLKSYAEIIVAFLDSKNSQVRDQFPGSTDTAAGDLAKLTDSPATTERIHEPLEVGRYEYTTNYFSEILAEIELINQKFEAFEQGLMASEKKDDIESREILLANGAGQKEIDRLKVLLPDIKDSDRLNLLPAKLTVSEVSAAERNLDVELTEQPIFPTGMADMGYTLRKPEFESQVSQPKVEPQVDKPKSESKVDKLKVEPQVDKSKAKQKMEIVKTSGKEFGTFIHSLMQFIKLDEFLSQPSTEWSDIYQEQIAKMILKQQLFTKNKAQADAAYPLIEQFLHSDLAARLYQVEKSGQPVYREIPFTLAIPATLEISPISPIPATAATASTPATPAIPAIPATPATAPTPTTPTTPATLTTPATPAIESSRDQILIQGMIDLWFVENDQAVLIDYKSDYISGTDEEIQEELEKRYSVQLKYYTMAIEKIIERPVKERYIWLFRQGKAYIL